MAKLLLVFSVVGAALLADVTALAQSLESTATLPRGVRNFTLRTVTTEIGESTNSAGTPIALANPLSQELTFGKIADGETKLKASQMRAFLASNGFSEDQVVGQFSADLKGRVEVTAPIFAYGVSDYLTFAVAVPYYKAVTAVEVGFTPNETAQAFLNRLADPENNQTASAREAGRKLNAAVANLNSKLIDNDYRALTDWRAEGVGDITLASKYRFVDGDILGMATSNGFVAPTGRTDDPNILTDIAFGDGQWDAFTQLAVDEKVGLGIRFNQYAKYTVQFPGDKIIREEEREEKIEVPQERVRFKLGDKYETGLSMNFEPDFGLVASAGYAYFRKYGDIYRELASETKLLKEDGTDQQSHTALYQIGYSTVPLYKAGISKIPLELKMTWVQQLASRNMPVSDLAQLDFNLFF